MNLQEEFGGIDVYLFDQLLKGRIPHGQPVLDAGCGGGRNMHFLLRQGFQVYGIDSTPEAIEVVRELSEWLAPGTDPWRFRVETIEKNTHPDGTFAFVICSAVLHFARDGAHFDAMLAGLWRVLAPEGTLFARLASGLSQPADQVRPVDAGSGRFHLPDGSERFLVDEEFLLERTERLGGQLLEPIKTVVVPRARSMATWCLRKPPADSLRG